MRDRIRQTEKPIKPKGAEWPFLRAAADGKLEEATAILQWIEGRMTQSPDEAENTED